LFISVKSFIPFGLFMPVWSFIPVYSPVRSFWAIFGVLRGFREAAALLESLWVSFRLNFGVIGVLEGLLEGSWRGLGIT